MAHSRPEPEQKLQEKKSIKNNNLPENFLPTAEKKAKEQIGNAFIINIKSEITSKPQENFIGNSAISKVRPPAPKTPPPPIPSHANTGKPPHPDTAPPDFLPDSIGKPQPLKTTVPDNPANAKMHKQSTFLVDTKTYAADIPIVGSTDYGKIDVSHPAAKKQEKAADELKFFANQKNFLLKVVPGSDAYAIKSKYKLTDTEAAAIVAYTDDKYYGPINHQFRTLKLDKVDISDAKALMDAGVKNFELSELIAALVSGMRKLPPTQVDESHFMALGRNVIMEEKEFSQYVEGAEIVTPTFLSTTDASNSMTSKEVGFWDAKDKALFIYQRVNGNARDIGAFSKFPEEKEILFLPYTKFKVLFVSKPSRTLAGATEEEIAADIKKHTNQNNQKSFLSKLSQLFLPNPVSNKPPTDMPLTKTFIAIQEIPFGASQMPETGED